MEDVVPYLYLSDLIEGRKSQTSIKYVFIDEIQDYSPLQLEYMKYMFPYSKFTMLGDINQSIFNKGKKPTIQTAIDIFWCRKSRDYPFNKELSFHCSHNCVYKGDFTRR